MAPHAKPWRVLVSEVMLQQIQVKHAILSYERLLARFATVEALAEGPPAEVPGVVAEERALYGAGPEEPSLEQRVSLPRDSRLRMLRGKR